MGAHSGARVASANASANILSLKELSAMSPTHALAREHLQRAAAALRGPDNQSRQLLHIVERTISLIDDMPAPPVKMNSNVLDFATYRDRLEACR